MGPREEDLQLVADLRSTGNDACAQLAEMIERIDNSQRLHMRQCAESMNIWSPVGMTLARLLWSMRSSAREGLAGRSW